MKLSVKSLIIHGRNITQFTLRDPEAEIEICRNETDDGTINNDHVRSRYSGYS